MMSRGKKITLLAGAVLLITFVSAAFVYRAHLRFWWLFESIGESERGYPEYRHRQTGLVMVRVPGGKFVMGSPEAEKQRYDNERPHEVTLSPFLMAKYETSQSEWLTVMDENPPKFNTKNHPVERVSWEDCQAFCRKSGLRLPTEAQWEYACRANTTTPFSFGDSITTDQANYNGQRRPYAGGSLGENRGETVPVDSFEPNNFGLHNMHGNVYEWCEDIYAADFYSRPDARGPDPLCLSGSGARVMRGGGWDGHVTFCRASFRGNRVPSSVANSVGFRPAYYSLP